MLCLHHKQAQFKLVKEADRNSKMACGKIKMRYVRKIEKDIIAAVKFHITVRSRKSEFEELQL